MSTGLVVPISGPYTGTWNALAIGTLSDAGYELACTIQGQELNETDAFGMTLVEWIYRGMNWRCRIRGLEWKSGLLGILQMFGMTGSAGTLTPQLGPIGYRATADAQALILTAILSNPPTTPQTLTANGATIAPQQQSTFNMTSKVRELPLELCLLPYSDGMSHDIPFSTT